MKSSALGNKKLHEPFIYTVPYRFRRAVVFSFHTLSEFGNIDIDKDIDIEYRAGTFNMPTSYQKWVWEREARINWSMVICQGSTRSELP